MKLNLRKAIILSGFMALSAFAQESKPATKLPEPPDKGKFSYAMGMHLGQEIKHIGVDADPDVLTQAVKDVLEGKTNEIKASEIPMVLRYAEVVAHDQQTTKNIADGAAFLAKNAKEPGVTVLPDGVQYRIIKEGTGEAAKRLDIVTISFRASWIDGSEFRHEDIYDIPFWACPKGLHEAMELMKTGSKWQIFVPFELVSIHQKEESIGYGSTLIYEIELIAAEAENAHPNHHHGAGGQLGHSLDEVFLPRKTTSEATLR